MRFLRSWVTRRPGWVALLWIAAAALVGLLAPNLTRLAAEDQAHLLRSDAESRRGSEELGRAWPDQSYESLAVAAVHRAGGLRPADLEYARGLAARIEGTGRPDAGASRTRARLATGSCQPTAQQGWDGRACGRATLHLVRRPGHRRMRSRG